jgi:hypothetical protein
MSLITRIVFLFAMSDSPGRRFQLCFAIDLNS